MGTTLTGTKPKDTYDSLIKVGDNGPIGATAKTLSDGLGNDLPISVSTSQVGIGTSSPTYSLQVKGSGDTTIGIEGGATGLSSLNLGNTANLADGGIRYDNATDNLIFRANNAERLRVLASGGLTFNGDTAAANALDDYEEGTWTPTMQGATFTYAGQLGYYTKIGRQVLVWLDIDASYSSPTGSFAINNLPFTQANGRGEGVVRPINGVVFTGYVTCEALGSLIYFSNNFTGVGTNTTDMDNTNFNAAGFRMFVSVSYTV